MEIVRTAGMVQGTPDWQLDMMYESESARMWEEQQVIEPVRELAKKDYDSLLEAWSALETAKMGFEMIDKYLVKAINRLDATPESYRIGSISDSLCDLADELHHIEKLLAAEKEKAFMEGRFKK